LEINSIVWIRLKVRTHLLGHTRGSAGPIKGEYISLTCLQVCTIVLGVFSKLNKTLSGILKDGSKLTTVISICYRLLIDCSTNGGDF